MRKWGLLGAACALCGATAALGAGSEKPLFAPPPAWVRVASPPAANDKNPEMPVQSLLVDVQSHLSREADETYVDSVAKIQTPQGLAQLGTLVLAWNPQTDVLTVHKLHILRDGQIIDVLANGREFTILRRESRLEYATLDGVLTATIQPEGLRIGDIIELAYTLSRSDPVLDGTSEYVAAAYSGIPVGKASVRVFWASGLPIHWRAMNGLSGIKATHAGGNTEISFTLENVEPRVPPKGAPARYVLGPRLEFTGFGSWEEVSRRLAPLYEKAALVPADSPIQAEIAKISASTPDPKSRAEQALMLLEDKVRYVYLGMNQGNLVPASAGVTWEQRFGDCKAKTALLLAMLRGLGIKADPVAVSSLLGDGLDSRAPMIAQFDHVLVRAEISGVTYWLDPTRTGDGLLEKIPTPGFKWALPLLAKGAGLVKIERQPLTEPNFQQSVRIDATAGIYLPAPFHVESTFTGAAATQLNEQLATLTPGLREEALRRHWKQQYDAVEVSTVSATYDRQAGREILLMDGLVKMDWSSSSYEADNMSLGYSADFSRPPGPDHDAPFAVDYPTYVKYLETIRLPPDQPPFTTKVEDVDRKIAGAQFHRTVHIDNSVVNAESSFRSLVEEFPAQEAEAAARSLKELSKIRVFIDMPPQYIPTDKELTAGLGRTPATVNAYIGRGNALMGKASYDLAIAEFDRALAIDPKSAWALADRGLARALKRDYGQAKQDLDAALNIDPKNPVVFRGRGYMEVVNGKPAEAIQQFTKSLDYDPTNSWALEFRGRTYSQIGDNRNALADIDAVLSQSPQRIDLRELRASILRKEGLTDQVIAEVRQMTSTSPPDPNAYFAAVRILRVLGKREEAILEATHATQAFPTVPDFLLLRAALRRASDTANRRSDIEAALALKPDYLPTLWAQAQLQEASQDLEGALKTLDALKARSGDGLALMTERAIVHLKAGNAELAQESLAAAHAKAVKALELNDFCWSLATANLALDVALKACQAAVALDVDNAAIKDSLGFVLLRLGRLEAAISAYDAALKARPGQGVSLFGRGVAYRLKGNLEASNADIREAESADPLIQETFADYGVKLD
jgi:tetratricopeptide (TPR) repeat protein